MFDVDDLQVLACDPPSNAVRVRVAGDSYVELAAPPAATNGREHLVVMRGPMLTWVNAHTEVPPWGSLRPDDLLLASVRLPAWTTTVQQAQIVDRRGFEGADLLPWRKYAHARD